MTETIERGYIYELANSGEGSQTLRFIKKVPTSPNHTTLDILEDGTTNEVVLAVIIDRLQFLDELVPSDFNKDAIMHVQAALSALESRTADRVKREVEGTHGV